MCGDPVKMQIMIQEVYAGAFAPLVNSQVMPHFESQGSWMHVKNANSWVMHPVWGGGLPESGGEIAN